MTTTRFSAVAVSAMAFIVAASGSPLADDPGLTLSGEPGAIRADSHAPIGVMGEHMHKAGEWMLSYRFMRMDMEGNRIGTDEVSPEDIVTTVPNPNPGPPTLRVVPTDMTTDMHMFGIMFAPTDWLTLMGMGSYQRKEMDHITFQGMMGTTRLGEFTTKSSGVGDTRLVGMFGLYDDNMHHAHLNLGISFPTGSIDETDDVLAPTGMRPILTLPYPMQLGSGTYDFLPGVTYTGKHARLGWGAQYAGTVRLGDNDAGYALGDQHELTAWGSYLWNNAFSTSLRFKGRTLGKIDGMDPRITAPVQTADPNAQGGDRIDISLGFNLAGQSGFLRGHRIAFEIGTPIYQDLNGPQLVISEEVLMRGGVAAGSAERHEVPVRGRVEPMTVRVFESATTLSM